MTTFKKSQRNLLRLGFAGTVVVLAALAVALLSGSLLSGTTSRPAMPAVSTKPTTGGRIRSLPP